MIIIASDGVIIRIQANSIRECARPSKGVLVMRLTEDSKVVTLARSPHEEEGEEEDAEEEGPDDGQQVDSEETEQ